jgi:hypothetical protein
MARKYDLLSKMGFVEDTTPLADRILALEERQTLFVDYWTSTLDGITPVDDGIWFDTNTNENLYIYLGGVWVELPLSTASVYIRRETNVQYGWSGSVMVELTVPLTKASIEALVYSAKLTLPALAIDLAVAEVFEKTLTGATAFTISNPRNFKPFRLILTGGSLSVPTFTGYTVNWINTSLVTDYVNTITNVLWCEIRATGQIYCFWGN